MPVLGVVSERVRKLQLAISALVLEGSVNSEIAKLLGVRLRTVKAHMGRLFKMHGITTGVKRVQLAVILYREKVVRDILEKKREDEAEAEKEAEKEP